LRVRCMSFRRGANMTRRLLGLAFGLALAQGSALAADYSFPSEPPPIAINSFLGGYAALGGSYGTGSPRSFNVTSSFIGAGSDGAFFGNASPTGWSGVAVTGYNMTFGPALIGIELDGRWGDESSRTPVWRQIRTALRQQERSPTTTASQMRAVSIYRVGLGPSSAIP
jgi:hypothetical protein